MWRTHKSDFINSATDNENNNNINGRQATKGSG